MSLSSMIEKLSPLGIYDLREGSIVYAELAAFSVGLDILKESLNELLKEGFINTAQNYGIENTERLVGSVREDLDLAKRREMLIERLSFGSGDFTPDGFKKMLIFMGVEGEVQEYPFTQRISLDLRGEFCTLAQREWIVSQAKALLPAHLEWDVIFAGFCWGDSDKNSSTFAEIDAKGYTWEAIDYLTI